MIFSIPNVLYKMPGMHDPQRAEILMICISCCIKITSAFKGQPLSVSML